MRKVITRERVLLFGAMALIYLCIRIVSDAHSFPDHPNARAVNNAWRILWITPLHFLFFEWTLRYWRRRGWPLSLLLLAAHILLWSAGLMYWRNAGIALGIYTPLTEFRSLGHNASQQFYASLMALVLFAVLRHLYLHYKLRQDAQRLRIEKQEAELNYLKAQTNPHFLFNTLNNIYALASDKSDAAPEAVLRLSGILRFMLYEAGGDRIAISEELRIIDDYLELERLRYDERLRISFRHDVEDGHQALPPLLLLPLVENAFKHGVSETRGGSFVEIDLRVKNRRLAFTVRNSADPDPGMPVEANIGLSNLRRQLELLYTDYALELLPGNNDFTTRLTINLASHV
ncbi:sensor histidine kinase [Flaviaesturariibacter aridisoli]|uniref:Histidine kinase n=1 Tax=Flaviaesturariibacter aridisoli TaxID=2545761 RepID=A0A4R4DZW2_9BACT|nr:sensor histidine kinase [Flaviaesturariibacter aridisoli]TCZ67047.1 histidine kinase [Flaviaesturariibacter aridisoli]